MMFNHMPPMQPNNPTDEERHELLKYALNNVDRLEDYENIIEELSPPEDITSIANPGEFKGIKVGIIGGGLAGMSTAYELRKLGYDITIFEANPKRIGGRVYTYFFNKEKNLYGELGPMRIPVGHETTWHYINHFKLDTTTFVQTNEKGFIYVRGIRVRNDPEGKNVMEKIYPEFILTPRERKTSWEKLLLEGLETPIHKISVNVRKEILQILDKYSDEMNYWTYFNTRQVMTKMNLSKGALDVLSCISRFVGAFYYNSYSENFQDDYSVDGSFVYRMIGGFYRLTNSFHRSLTSVDDHTYSNISSSQLGRVNWKSGAEVIAIYQENDNKVSLTYKQNDSKVNLYDRFDYVVCAIPFSTLRNVDITPDFSPIKMEAIREVNYGAAQKTLMLCKKRFWEEDTSYGGIIGGSSRTDLPISQIYYPDDHSKMTISNRKEWRNSYRACPYDSYKLKEKHSPDEPGVLLSSYNFNLDAIRLGNLEEEKRVYEIKRQVEAVHGLCKGYLDSIVEDYKTVQWNKEVYALGAFCHYTPEQKKLFSYGATLPEHNDRVFFSGEQIDPKHGWIQGALHSAMIAANELAKVCKKRTS